MERKPNLLFLAQCLPYPPHSGVTNRTFNLLNQLRGEFRVTLVAFSRRNHQIDPAARAHAREALEALGIEVAGVVPVAAEQSAARRVRDHLWSCVTRRPYTYYEYGSRTFASYVSDAVARRRFTLIHIDSLDLHGFLSPLPVAPITCTHHSIESELLRLRAARIGSRALRAYIRHQAELVEEVERRLCPDFAANVMMSDLDASRLMELAPGSRTITVPNGVDVDYMQPAPDVRRVPGRVLFLGPSYMFPNRDAVEYFLGEIWTHVRFNAQAGSLTLVGRSPQADRERFERSDGVKAVGHAQDIRPHIAESSCCVAPLRVGGGTRLKILDYWAMGKAVVSTTIGCEGLDAVDGHNILIRDDPTGFAKAVAEVLTNDDLRLRLETNARRTAEETYSWRAIGSQMVTSYMRLLKQTAAA